MRLLLYLVVAAGLEPALYLESDIGTPGRIRTLNYSLRRQVPGPVGGGIIHLAIWVYLYLSILHDGVYPSASTITFHHDSMLGMLQRDSRGAIVCP